MNLLKKMALTSLCLAGLTGTVTMSAATDASPVKGKFEAGKGPSC